MAVCICIWIWIQITHKEGQSFSTRRYISICFSFYGGQALDLHIPTVSSGRETMCCFSFSTDRKRTAAPAKASVQQLSLSGKLPDATEHLTWHHTSAFAVKLSVRTRTSANGILWTDITMLTYWSTTKHTPHTQRLVKRINEKHHQWTLMHPTACERGSQFGEVRVIL